MAGMVERLGGAEPNGDDPRITQRNVRMARVVHEPVDNRRATDQQIVYPGPPPAMSGARRY